MSVMRALPGVDRPAGAAPPEVIGGVASLRPPPAVAQLLVTPLPASLARYSGEPVPALGPGTAGKVGWLDLRLAAHAGRTRLVHADARVPFHVGRLQPALGEGEPATLCLVMPTGGIVQGDRLAVRVTAEAGARLRLTTPGATQIYSMRANYALQAVELIAHPGAWLDWGPGPTIPHRQARYHQPTSLVVAPGTVLLWSEVLLPGRLAHGERYAYDWLALDLTVHTLAGALICQERQSLMPGWQPLTRPGRLRHYAVLGSVYLLAPGRPLQPLLDGVRTRLHDAPDVLAGASLLPDEAGVVVRLLTPTSSRAVALIHEVKQVAWVVLDA